MSSFFFETYSLVHKFYRNTLFKSISDRALIDEYRIRLYRQMNNFIIQFYFIEPNKFLKCKRILHIDSSAVRSILVVNCKTSPEKS
jgi:hypothetical protein